MGKKTKNKKFLKYKLKQKLRFKFKFKKNSFENVQLVA